MDRLGITFADVAQKLFHKLNIPRAFGLSLATCLHPDKQGSGIPNFYAKHVFLGLEMADRFQVGYFDKRIRRGSFCSIPEADYPSHEEMEVDFPKVQAVMEKTLKSLR